MTTLPTQSPKASTTSSQSQPRARRNSELPAYYRGQPMIPIGKLVQVNQFRGRIVEVEFEIRSRHPQDHRKRTRIPLRAPLYKVQLDRSKSYGWVWEARQVHLPDSTTELKVFRDEFDVVAEW